MESNIVTSKQLHVVLSEREVDNIVTWFHDGDGLSYTLGQFLQILKDSQEGR